MLDQSSARPPLAVNASRPLNSERTKPSPRIRLPRPSGDGKSGEAPPYGKRVTVTPGTRCRASATERSGRLETSDAVTESTNVSALRLTSAAFSSDARMPVTTMVCSSPSDACVVAGLLPDSCAFAFSWAAAMADDTAMAMADVPMSRRSNFDLDLMHSPLCGALLNSMTRWLRNEPLRVDLQPEFYWCAV